jgi:hypothetical protein
VFLEANRLLVCRRRVARSNASSEMIGGTGISIHSSGGRALVPIHYDTSLPLRRTALVSRGLVPRLMVLANAARPL